MKPEVKLMIHGIIAFFVVWAFVNYFSNKWIITTVFTAVYLYFMLEKIHYGDAARR